MHKDESFPPVVLLVLLVFLVVPDPMVAAARCRYARSQPVRSSYHSVCLAVRFHPRLSVSPSTSSTSSTASTSSRSFADSSSLALASSCAPAACRSKKGVRSLAVGDRPHPPPHPPRPPLEQSKNPSAAVLHRNHLKATVPLPGWPVQRLSNPWALAVCRAQSLPVAGAWSPHSLQQRLSRSLCAIKGFTLLMLYLPDQFAKGIISGLRPRQTCQTLCVFCGGCDGDELSERLGLRGSLFVETLHV